MDFLNYADEIIPGFSLLSQEVRSKFETSADGSHFVKEFFAIVQEKQNAIKAHKQQYSSKTSLSAWKHYFNTTIIGYEDLELSAIEQQYKDNLNKLQKLSRVQYPSFIQVLEEINFYTLKKIYPEADELLLKKLAKSSSCHNLTSKLRASTKLKKYQSFGNAFDECISNTKAEESSFITDFEKEIQEEQIEALTQFDKFKAKQYIKNLSEFLPLVKHSSIYLNLSLKVAEDSTTKESLETYAQKELETFFYDCMAANISPNFDLTKFNHNQADLLAHKVHKAFLEKQLLNFEQWLADYEFFLQFYIESKLKFNPKAFSTAPLANNSLSEIFKSGADYLKPFADTISFMQFFGITSQNDNVILAVKDVFNGLVYQEEISEYKKILYGLLSPLAPLYKEYRAAALLEDNIFLKIFRILMPIFIVSSVIIATAFLLGPLALPELAFAAAMIPTLIVGLIFASTYAHIKNKIYQYARELYYCSIWNLPEYGVTEILKAAFGDKAPKIRDFYINEIKTCKKLQESYQSKILLSPEETVLNKANSARLQQLNLEWLDISANKKLSNQQVLIDIVYERLKAEHNVQYTELLKDLGCNSISEVTSQMAKTVKNRIEKGNTEEIQSLNYFAPQTFFGKASPVMKKITETLELMEIVSPKPASTVLEVN